MRLHGGVEHLAQHGEAETEEQPEHQSQGDVAHRLRRDGRVGSRGVSTTVAFSSGTVLPGGVSSSPTNSWSCVTTPSLIRCAWIGGWGR